ncbi:hypothetical protein PIIN_04491 [Serendipita indica DSM 11827]|uniref:DUF1746 domain-containing protein n=1 Tax=Serendipita indica (strain DSM 11827) TaxID=1109443 RepID=G4TGW6_SERID|nr:hypothetical protein PIIN_04491 [Serendipita indica DSM 11827]
MRYSAQREHVLKSLTSLLLNLYALSYLLYPSFSLFALRWIVQWSWLTLQKEVVRHKLRWTFIPLSVFGIALWIHTSPRPASSIILDFIGHAQPPALSIILFLDVTITFIELLAFTILYWHLMILMKTIEDLDPRRRERSQKAAIRSRRDNLVLDMSLSQFAAICWDPRSLFLSSPQDTSHQATNLRSQDEEGEENERLLGEDSRDELPRPFNLRSEPRTPRPQGNTIPGALTQDW